MSLAQAVSDGSAIPSGAARKTVRAEPGPKGPSRSARMAILLSLLGACAHAGGRLLTTMPTVGPRSAVLDVDPPLRVGPASVVCLAAPEGFTARLDGPAFVSAKGEPVAIRAALAQEDGEARVELPVASLRRVGDSSFLCLAAASPPAQGAVFNRLTVTAPSALLLPEIVWIEGKGR